MFSYIYLASQSPRRQELLKQIGVQFEMLIAAPGEDTETLEIPLPQEKARDYVQRVTFAKSAIALARWQKSGKPWAPILCADTTVSVPDNSDGEILGKPSDAADAARILEMLSGKTHEVLTAVALMVDPKWNLHTLLLSKLPAIFKVVSLLAKRAPMEFRAWEVH
jgi:septum formation protein